MKHGTQSDTETPAPDDYDDPGARICDHPNRVHALGANIFVCFECWACLVGRRIGARR